MVLKPDSMKPIYMQIADWLEDEILNGHFKAHDKVFSQYQLAEMFNINPATAAKGLTILVDGEMVYKKRGLGMFVTEEAKQLIFNKRKNLKLKKLVTDLVTEAKQLQVGEQELIEMIQQSMNREGEQE